MPEFRYPFPPEVAALFGRTSVAAPIAHGVLEGKLPGVIAADCEIAPRWAVGRLYWNVGFAAGDVNRLNASDAATALARWGEFGVFQGDDDRRIQGGEVVERVEWSGPRRPANLPKLPDEFRIEPLTADLLARCHYSGTQTIWGGRFFEMGFGSVVMHGDVIACEAPLFAAGARRAELSVYTAPTYRGRGLARVLCDHVACRCEARGWTPTSSCDRSNVASVRVARTLGFAVERHSVCVRIGPGRRERP